MLSLGQLLTRGYLMHNRRLYVLRANERMRIGSCEAALTADALLAIRFEDGCVYWRIAHEPDKFGNAYEVHASETGMPYLRDCHTWAEDYAIYRDMITPGRYVQWLGNTWRGVDFPTTAVGATVYYCRDEARNVIASQLALALAKLVE